MTRKHKRHIAKWLMRRPLVRMAIKGNNLLYWAARGAIMRLIKERMTDEMWLVFPPEE